MVIKDRNFYILDSVIRDYIETAEPVSSSHVHKRIRNSLSTATIRNIMVELDQAGYLEQPHTSAGRIPTDKGYRYFVDMLLGDASVYDVRNDVPHRAKDAHEFVKAVAEELGMFTLFAHDPNELFWAGMEDIFEEPEFHDHDVARAFASFIEHMPKRIQYYFKYSGDVPQVLIGKENPFPEAAHFSSVIGRPSRTSLIISIGPKRMDYEHATAVIRKLLHSELV